MDVQDLGTILTIWAHPDDETFTSGGLMSQAVANGQKVICVTATHGEQGIQDENRWPADQLGNIRSKELEAGLKLLGVTDHEWLDCHDGECANASTDEMAEQIKKLIDKYQPDTIVTFGPDGLTGHPDHQAVSAWVSAAAKGRDVKVLQAATLDSVYNDMREADERFNIFFNVEQPVLSEVGDCALVLELTPELLDKKYQALSAMPSQYEKMFSGLGRDNVHKMLSTEAFKLAAL